MLCDLPLSLSAKLMKTTKGIIMFFFFFFFLCLLSKISSMFSCYYFSWKKIQSFSPPICVLDGQRPCKCSYIFWCLPAQPSALTTLGSLCTKASQKPTLPWVLSFDEVGDGHGLNCLEHPSATAAPTECISPIQEIQNTYLIALVQG